MGGGTGEMGGTDPPTTPGRGITSARSTRLGADYTYEDSGSCVSGEEEGGIV